MPTTTLDKRTAGLGLFLIVAGAIGWFAAFELTLAKFEVLVNPQADLNCDVSVIVQCGKNLTSWEGSVFGFPNPLLGIAGFVAPIAVGVSLLAGARFARWFWMLFNAGLVFALGFVVWLITHSIFELGTLCPWCMVVWAVTIPMFWAVTLYNLSLGGPARARRFFAEAFSWVPLLTIASYLVVGVVAQIRLDVIGLLITG